MTALEKKKEDTTLCSLLVFGINFLMDQLQYVHVRSNSCVKIECSFLIGSIIIPFYFSVSAFSLFGKLKGTSHL